MKSPSEVFIVPAEIFALLNPLEKIVIRRQAERGEVQITEPQKEIRA